MRVINVVLCLFILFVGFVLSTSCRNAETEIGEIIELEPDLVIDGNADLDNLFTPGAILINSEQRIFIIDPVCIKVVAYDSNGRNLFEFGRPGEGPGEFSWLNLHCDIDCNDDIYLVNMPHWIEVFSSNGEYLERISPDVEHIFDFAVYDSSTIFINAVALNDWGDYHPVIEIDRTGEIVNAFGYIGVDTENMPRWEKFAVLQCVIDVDDEGYIYYTSVVDYRIFKYDPEGNLVFTVEGSTPFEARYEPQPPHGMRTLIPVVMDLCVDQNRVYVLWGQGAEERGSRVDVLDKDTGELLGYFYTQVPTEQCNVFIEVIDGTFFYTASYSDAIVYKFTMIH
ncbi:MAG: hypothetical protein GF388_10960 [Candidatus Aegiribacteria sp.]|nr:hypothetical protein [Candidatus Aegiribacteria sp.]